MPGGLGVPGRWVTPDTVYGQDPLLRARLDEVAADVQYVLAVPVTTPVWIAPARCSDEPWQRAGDPGVDGAHGSERDGGAGVHWLAAHRRGGLHLRS